MEDLGVLVQIIEAKIQSLFPKNTEDNYIENVSKALGSTYAAKSWNMLKNPELDIGLVDYYDSDVY